MGVCAHGRDDPFRQEQRCRYTIPLTPTNGTTQISVDGFGFWRDIYFVAFPKFMEKCDHDLVDATNHHGSRRFHDGTGRPYLVDKAPAVRLRLVLTSAFVCRATAERRRVRVARRFLLPSDDDRPQAAVEGHRHQTTAG